MLNEGPVVPVRRQPLVGSPHRTQGCACRRRDRADPGEGAQRVEEEAVGVAAIGDGKEILLQDGSTRLRIASDRPQRDRRAQPQPTVTVLHDTPHPVGVARGRRSEIAEEADRAVKRPLLSQHRLADELQRRVAVGAQAPGCPRRLVMVAGGVEDCAAAHGGLG